MTDFSFIQVVEQDVHSFEACNSSAPEKQQTCTSRTGSGTSIVTIVENGRRDSQREFPRDGSGIRQSSLAPLQRDSSVRRSWRASREGRNSRLLPVDMPGNGGDGAAEGTKRIGDDPQNGAVNNSELPVVSQQPSKKEADQVSKWMLNDGEEIVIRDSKSNVSLLHSSQGNNGSLITRESELLVILTV